MGCLPERVPLRGWCSGARGRCWEPAPAVTWRNDGLSLCFSTCRRGRAQLRARVWLWAVVDTALVPALALTCALCCVVFQFGFSFCLLTFSFSFPPSPLPACPPCLYCMRQSVSWWGGWAPPPFPCLCQLHILGRKSPVWISSLWPNPHLYNPIVFLCGW